MSVHYTLFDLSGSIVLKQIFSNGSGSQKDRLSLDDLNSGLYILRIEYEGKMSQHKIVVQ